ncbi:uncharacterized protein TNCV_4673151 [Trichonephila clavipes]|nr:uncharacterized protein TNCV_4673151 [Trichonephila clavipes]
MSSYCPTCKRLQTMPRNFEYESSKADHICQCDFTGSSSKMEIMGASRIFLRSEKNRRLHYTQYYGDGDSKAFMSVKDTYGLNSVTKFECIGHVQKRVDESKMRLWSRPWAQPQLAQALRHPCIHKTSIKLEHPVKKLLVVAAIAGSLDIWLAAEEKKTGDDKNVKTMILVLRRLQDNIPVIQCRISSKTASTNLSNSCTYGLKDFPKSRNDIFVDSKSSATLVKLRLSTRFPITLPRGKSSG